MPGKNFNMVSLYTMFKVDGGSCSYAATQNMYHSDNVCVFWGTLDENNVFTPNKDFKALPKESQEMFIFPEDWDLRNVEYLKDKKIDFNPEVFNLLVESGSLNDVLDKFIGGYYFIYLLLDKYGIEHTFNKTFHNDKNLIEYILNSIIVIELINLSFNPAIELISDTYETTYMHFIKSFFNNYVDTINYDYRAKFIELRVKNYSYKLDTIFVTFVTNIRFNNDEDDQDNSESSTTVTAIAYSVNKYEPLYYRTFEGDDITIKIINSVKSDLSNLGINNIKFLFNADHYLTDNISTLISQDIPFIIVNFNKSKEIYSHISEIKYDESEKPLDMDYVDECEISYKLIDLSGKEYKLNNGEKIIADNYKCNIAVSDIKRLEALNNIDSKILEEAKLLDEKKSSNSLKDEYEELNAILTYHKIIKKNSDDLDSDGDNFKIILNETRIKKDKTLAGVCGLLMNKIDCDVDDIAKIYQLKLDQDLFFNISHDQINCYTRVFDLFYRDIDKEGIEFSIFCSLLLHIKILYTLKNSIRIKDMYTPTTMVNMMEDLNKNLESKLKDNPTVRSLTAIFRAFGINIMDIFF